MIQTIELRHLRESPTNPREAFTDIDELAAELSGERGLMTPLVVRQLGDVLFEIVCGHRRYRALKKAGALYASCSVREMSDRDAAFAQLADTAHGCPLTAMEQARAIGRLRDDFKLPRERIAKGLGKSIAWVADRIALLSLPPAALAAIQAGNLSATHARYIAKQPDDAARTYMAKSLAKGPRLSVAEARERFGQLPSGSLYIRGQRSDAGPDRGGAAGARAGEAGGRDRGDSAGAEAEARERSVKVNPNQEKSMANELKPGDVVALKSGGPEMTIERVCADGDLQCVWMAIGQAPDRGAFKPSALRILRPATPPEPSSLERAAEEHRKASGEVKAIRAKITVLDEERNRLSALEDAAGDRAFKSGERMKQMARGEPVATGRTDGCTVSATPSSA